MYAGARRALRRLVLSRFSALVTSFLDQAHRGGPHLLGLDKIRPLQRCLPRPGFCLEGCRLSLASGVCPSAGHATAAASSSSAMTSRVLAGSTLIPGPIDVVTVMLWM